MLNSQACSLMERRWGTNWAESRALMQEAKLLLSDLQHDPGSARVEAYRRARTFPRPC
jgi:hypothetical protein